MRCYRAHVQYAREPELETITINASDTINRRAEIIVQCLPINLRLEHRRMFVEQIKDVLEKYAVLDSKATAAAIKTTARKKTK